MAYSITYTAGGVTYDLNGVNAGLGITIRYLGDQGFGLTPLHRITQRGPLQDGDSDVGFRLDPRIVQLPLLVEAMTIDAGYDARKALLKIFSPLQGAGILRVVTSSYDRSLTCYPLGGMDFNQQPEQGYHVRTVMQLRAADPTWYDSSASTTVSTPTVAGTATPVPLVIPWTTGQANINTALTITSAGDYIAYPVITCEGPISDLIILNATTNAKIEFVLPINSGETWTIDLSYGQKRVFDQTGASQIAAVSADSSLATWGIVPGANSITISSTTSGTNASVEFTYYPRYIGI